MLIVDSLGGWNRPVAQALSRHLKTYGNPAHVTRVDLFDDVLPGISVLARLAQQRAEQITPVIVGDVAEARRRGDTAAFLQELDGGGLERLEARIRSEQPAVILCVSPVAAALATEASRGSVPTVGVVAALSVQNVWFHPLTDLQFVMAAEIRDDLVMRGLPYNRIVVTGVGILGEQSRVEDRALARRKAGFADRFTAALSVSGAHASEVRRIASRLTDIGVQVVTVGDERPRGSQQRRSESVSSHADVTAREATSVSDVVVAGSDTLTLLEAVCTGVPSVIYNPGQGGDVASGDFLVNVGASLLARDTDDICEKVRFLSSHPERCRQMESVTHKLGKGNGTRLICERVMALCD
jgi:processive 1,2-diacylglycerol beta-glucosyltransferase